MRSERERLLSKAVINWETGCWEWTAKKDRHGYGLFSTGKSSGVAHRAAYRLLVGPIPTGLVLDHLCLVRHCINPAHLEPVTQRENARRVFGHVNTDPEACPAGHPRTPENTYGSKESCRVCNRAAVARYRTNNRERVNAQQRNRRRRARSAAATEGRPLQ